MGHKAHSLVGTFAAAVVICMPPSASAQTAAAPATIEVGVKAGLNLASMAIPSAHLEAGWDILSLRGLAIGGWVQRDVASGLVVRIEGMLSQKGMTPRLRDNSFGDEIEARTQIRLTYFDVPLLVGWRSQATEGPRFVAFAGPTLGFKMSSSIAVESVTIGGVDVTRELGGDIEDELDDFDLDDSIAGTDFGFTFGAGVEIGHLTADARYIVGFSDVTTRADSAETKNRTFSVMIGYRFR